MPNPRLGYLLVALSAACSALNGSLARYLLDDGMSAVRLSQLRSAVSFALLALGLALLSRGRLKIAKADVPKLAWLGVAGIALVHASYFAAIARIDIGVALALEPAQPRLGARRVGDRHARPVPADGHRAAPPAGGTGGGGGDARARARRRDRLGRARPDAGRDPDRRRGGRAGRDHVGADASPVS